ncbi:BA14K family protein [Methylorubrum extorquens]
MKLLLALATVGATLTALPALAGPASKTAFESLISGDLTTGYAQYRRFGHRHGYYGGRGYGRGYGYRRGPGVGAAVGAGVAGLAAGAIIGGAIANSQAQASPGASADAVAYCARRFRSYDASSGTYLGNDGARHACP